MQIQVELPEKLLDVFDGPADVRWSCGGRGSGKTRSFAKMAALYGYKYGMAGTSGIILCARQFMNSLADSSLEEVKRAIEDEPFLAAYYEIGEKYIKSRDGRISFAFAGLDRNIASIKSKGRLLLCWVDEAEPVTDEAWSTLEPTLREEGEGWRAELWVTWNPLRKTAAVESRYRLSKDPNVKGCILNWRDNPKFPAVLERKRLRDKEERPGEYPHIWEGEYATVITGAYYAEGLLKAKEEGRLSTVPHEPSVRVQTFWDLGISDSMSIWFAQVVGREVRVIDYYEAAGYGLDHYARVLSEKPYVYERHYAPHDIQVRELGSGRSRLEIAASLGIRFDITPQVGVKDGIDALRMLLPRCWIDEKKCSIGLEALGAYHEKFDDKRGISLGPMHDWASHAADAARYMAVALQEQTQIKKPSGQVISWMG